MSEDAQQIVFPRDWEFRAFCQSAACDSVAAAVPQLLKEKNSTGTVEQGELSKSGTYRALRVTAMVQSREHATEIAVAIAALPGVKFML